MRMNLGSRIPPGLRDTGLLCGWIAGILLIVSLGFFLTQPLRMMALARSVNRVLAAEQLGIRLREQPLASWRMPGRAMQAGVWFPLAGSGGRAVVFPIVHEGIFLSYVAVLSPQGGVDYVLPLSKQGSRLYPQLPQAVRALHVQRIERGNALITAALEARR